MPSFPTCGLQASFFRSLGEFFVSRIWHSSHFFEKKKDSGMPKGCLKSQGHRLKNDLILLTVFRRVYGVQQLLVSDTGACLCGL